MAMSYMRFNIGKAVPLLLKNPMLARANIPLIGIDHLISKPLIGVAATQKIHHSMVLGAVAQDRTSASWQMLLVAPISINNFRFCTTNAPNPIPSSPNPSPTPPSVPNKKQEIEKAFFRVVAFFWDNGGSFIAILSEFFKTVVIEAPTVQFYWKRFHEKMDEAKRNDN